MIKKIVGFLVDNNIETRTQLREMLKKEDLDVNQALVEGVFAEYKKNPDAMIERYYTPLMEAKIGKSKKTIFREELEAMVGEYNIQQIADHYGVCYLTMHRIIHKFNLGDKIKTGRPSLKVVNQ